MDELSFKKWITENTSAPITSSGTAGEDIQKSIEDAIRRSPDGNKMNAAKQAVDKLILQDKGKPKPVKDSITIAAAQDKISSEFGNLKPNMKK